MIAHTTYTIFYSSEGKALLLFANTSFYTSSSCSRAFIFLKQSRQSIALLYIWIFLPGLNSANLESSFEQLSQLFIAS